MSDCKGIPHEYIQGIRKRQYDSLSIHTAYKAMRTTLDTAVPTLPLQRKLQVIGTRLMLGNNAANDQSLFVIIPYRMIY